ncbi:MAG: cytochrome c biogenesis protein CcdA [bacterium]
MYQLLSNFEPLLNSTSLLAFPIAFLAGIITSCGPCTYPMIPVIVGYIGGSKTKSRLASLILSSFFALGLAITYSALGAVASLTGSIFGVIQTNPYINIIVANIFILFGLSMLDVLRIPVPTFLQRLYFRGQKGSVIGAFVLGLATGIIASPCVLPIMGSLLTYVATKQHVFFGMSLLFVYSLGMSFLFIVAGTFTGVLTSLPKFSYYMVKVQRLSGFFMIGLGEYFLINAGRLL